MARGDYRFGGETLPLTHHSSRGRVQRNSGSFTRGSQLLTHEVLMWSAGAKLPLILWCLLLVSSFACILALRLDEHGVQLICMKLYAVVWEALGGAPSKLVNLTLPDDSVRRTAMVIVPHVPQVKLAWTVAVRALVGAALLATFATIPLAMWFVDFSKQRGRRILQERHERGAMLVDRALLRAEIVAYNLSQFTEEARQKFPALNASDVLALPFETRREAGIHHPYCLADIPYPHRLEQSHTMLIGTTGSGKTTELKGLVTQMRARGDTAVIFDLTGSYVEAFYDPARDTILNPMDERCPAWSIFTDCTTHAEFTSAAAALIPADGGSSEPFWALAARTLFIEMCVKLRERGESSNAALSDRLMTADLKHVHRFLADTIADPLTAPEAARMAESIRAVFNTNAQVLRFLPDHGPDFSIRDWISGAKPAGSILFVTSSYGDLTMNRALLTLWMDIAMTRLMALPRTRELRVWFMFDELGALHRLPALETGLQTARAFGGAMVLGIHSFEKLVEVYGEQGAKNLGSLARTKLVLATADLDTAETCARYIGNREVRQMDEAYSYGYNNTRDASTLTPRKQIEPLVIADDITNLPSMHGFVKFPDGFPAARVELKWRDYPAVARGFESRSDPTPLCTRRVEERPSDGGGGGRDNIAAAASQTVDTAGQRHDRAAPFLPLWSDDKSVPSPAQAPVADRPQFVADAARANGQGEAAKRGEAGRSPTVEDRGMEERAQDIAEARADLDASEIGI